MEFFAWARDSGAVHVKAPGGYEAVWLPPDAGAAAAQELPEDPQFEEVSMAQWTKMRPPGMK